MTYQEFLSRKSQLGGMSGFEPLWMPDWLKDFQQHLTDWMIRKGRGACFAACGLGKTPMQLVWADNIVRRTNGRVLIVTPLAVSPQTVREGEKFGIECRRSVNGKNLPASGIIVTNYERLHYFDPPDFAGLACDESGCIKDFEAERTSIITEFMRLMEYRSLWSAQPSPNDFIELGTSSESLGELGYMDMLGQFFKNDDKTLHLMGQKYGDLTQKGWRFRPHSERHFWRWVCSWARACRKPSDLGFDDGEFILPPLEERMHTVKRDKPRPGFLFNLPAESLEEEREERRATMSQRCELVAKLVDHKLPAVAWCHLNPEGDLLERLIPDARQVCGSQPDEEKEELFAAFAAGQLRVLVTKPKIGAWGMNWQHCCNTVVFPSHSFEQYHQLVHRFHRFGQKNKVLVDIVASDGEVAVQNNLQRKASAADRMFSELVEYMHDAERIGRTAYGTSEMEIPAWL